MGTVEALVLKMGARDKMVEVEAVAITKVGLTVK
jgi:hypothetical protein